MTNKNLVFNRHAFTDKGMTGDFAFLADFGIFLNFNERPNLRIVSHFATVEVDELRKLYVRADLHVGRNTPVIIHNSTAFPRSCKDWSAASSILTTRKPATPSFRGLW